MELAIYNDHETLSLKVAEAILAMVKEKPAAVLSLATGDTPKLAYSMLVEKAAAENVDFSRCSFIGLDEWIGIPPETAGSCRHFLETRLFQPLNIQAAQVHLFDGMAFDLQAECTSADEFISQRGGIDLILVGVGLNGHIGFNEPGISANLHAHIITLDAITQSTGQKYFASKASIKQGITLGLKQVLESRNLIMMANGSRKADIMKKAIGGPVSEQVPASLMRNHGKAIAMLDEPAASQLDLRALPPEIVRS